MRSRLRPLGPPPGTLREGACGHAQERRGGGAAGGSCRPSERRSALDTQVQGRAGLGVRHPLELW